MKIVSMLAISLLFTSALLANKAIIYNETNYPMNVEWHTTGFCPHKPNVSIPANQKTEIDWGICNSTKSIWSASIGINPTKNVITVDDETHYGFNGNRVWHVTVQAPKTRVPDPMDPTRYYDVVKAIRFSIKVDPWKEHKHLYTGGNYVGPWFDAITGLKLSKEEIKKYGLEQ